MGREPFWCLKHVRDALPAKEGIRTGDFFFLREKYDDDNFVLQVGGCFWMEKIREELILIQKVIKRVVKRVLQEKSFSVLLRLISVIAQKWFTPKSGNLKLINSSCKVKNSGPWDIQEGHSAFPGSPTNLIFIQWVIAFHPAGQSCHNEEEEVRKCVSHSEYSFCKFQ